MAGREITFDDKDFIVSKTDLAGKIIYGNEVFIRMSGYTEEELLEQPHSILRHPDMPSSVFKLMWDKIKQGQEVFAYVVNTTKDSDYYWVMAHVTPSLDDNDNIIAYHSVRRKPNEKALQIIKPLYKSLLEAEKRGGISAGTNLLLKLLDEKKVTYEEFILSI